MSAEDTKPESVLKQAENFALGLKCGFLYSLPLDSETKVEDVVHRCFEKGIEIMDMLVSTANVKYKDDTNEKFRIPEKYESALRIVFWLLYKGYDPNNCLFFKYGEDRVLDDPLHESVQFYVVCDSKIVIESISYSYVMFKEESLANEVFFAKDGNEEIWKSSRDHERSLKRFWDLEFEKTVTSRQYRIATGMNKESNNEVEVIKFNRLIKSIREVKIILVIIAIVLIINLARHAP